MENLKDPEIEKKKDSFQANFWDFQLILMKFWENQREVGVLMENREVLGSFGGF